MSDDKKEEEVKPRTFTSIVKPSQEKIEELKNKESQLQEVTATVNDSVLSAQEKIYRGLSDTMANISLENMQKLAPEDSFTIEVNGNDKKFQRVKLKPKMIKELRAVQRQYNEEIVNIEDPDLRLDREHQLLAYKAKLYLGMSDDEFENCDVEYLAQVIQATELRTQGFRKC